MQETFYDFASYSAELSDIHAQFRRENGGARQAETLRERQDKASSETFGVDLELLEEVARLWEDALRAGQKTTLQAGERNGRMGATRNSLKEDESSGASSQERQYPEGAGPEDAVREFYAEAEGRGQTVRVFQRSRESGRGAGPRLGRFTEVRNEAASEIAAQTKAELDDLGVPAFIHNGDLEVLNDRGEILAAWENVATINHAAVGIANSIQVPPRETAGHEAYHF